MNLEKAHALICTVTLTVVVMMGFLGLTGLWQFDERFWFIVGVGLFPAFCALATLVVPIYMAVKMAAPWPLIAVLSCGLALAVVTVDGDGSEAVAVAEAPSPEFHFSPPAIATVCGAQLRRSQRRQDPRSPPAIRSWCAR